MKPTKQTVYLPVKGTWVEDKPTLMSSDGDLVCNLYQNVGYFFTPEQLNQLLSDVIKDALNTAAGKVSLLEDGKKVPYSRYFVEEGNHYNQTEIDVDKESITNTFEETYKKFEV